MSDNSEYIVIGLLVLSSPIWAPFLLIGWSAVQVYEFLHDKGVLK